jgi:hypothetical protein
LALDFEFRFLDFRNGFEDFSFWLLTFQQVDVNKKLQLGIELRVRNFHALGLLIATLPTGGGPSLLSFTPA